MKTAADPSKLPPKRWFGQMTKKVRESNPGYSEDQVNATIGKIWSNLSDAKKSEIRGREGKSYGPAKKESAVKTDIQIESNFEDDDLLAQELIDYGYNTSNIYKQRFIPIIKNLYKKIKKETYDHILAAKLWMYWVEDAAKGYIGEFADPKTNKWFEMFPKDIRQLAAKKIEEIEYENINKGVYDYLLVKKETEEEQTGNKKESYVNKITATTLKDLFTSDYKKWIQMEVQILAMNSGTYINEDQANSLLTAACDKLIKIIQDGVDEEVHRVVNEVREDVVESMIEDVQPPEPTPVPVEAPKQEQIAAPQNVPVPVASKKTGGKSEQEIAQSLKEKGYNYIILFNDTDVDPLYTKTMEQASRLVREDYKNEHVDIKKIDDFLSKKAQKEIQPVKQEAVKFMDFVDDFVNDHVSNVKVKHGPGEYGISTWFYTNDESRRVDVNMSNENLFSIEPYFNKNGEWVRPKHGIDVIELNGKEIIYPEDYTDYMMRIVNFLKRPSKVAQLEDVPPSEPKEEGPVSLTYEKFGPGKFDDNIQAFVYDKVLEGGGDETVGDEQFGIYDLITFEPPVTVKQDDEEWFFAGAIAYVSDQGFVYVDYFDTIDEAKKDFARIEKEYDKFVDEDPTED